MFGGDGVTQAQAIQPFIQITLVFMSQPSSAPTARPVPAFPVFVAMMALLMGLTAMSIDVMLPALPQIQQAFALGDGNQQQQTISSYMFGFAFGQILYGPLSDSFGRKRVLLTGIALFCVATVAAPFLGAFGWFLFARFLQGFGCAAARIVSTAIIRDIYGGREMAKVMSFVMMIFIMIPAIAPLVGTAVLAVGSWRLIFGLLFVAGVSAYVWMVVSLPETLPEERRKPLAWGTLGKAIAKAATNRVTLGYTVAGGVIFGALMGYVNSAQQVFQDFYATGSLFPFWFGSIACAMMLASIFNSRLVERIGMRRMSHFAILGFVTVALVHVGLFWTVGAPPVAGFAVLIGLNFFFFGVLMPNLNALAMEPMADIAGTASSFIGSVTTMMAAAFGGYIGHLFDGTSGPLLMGFAACGLGCLLLVMITEKGRLFGVSEDEPVELPH